MNINDYTQADTFDCEIEYKQFPFDPRCLRAVGITIHMEDVGSLYDDGTNSPTRINPSRENTVFIGFADEESISFDDTKRTVRFEGRDYTSLLIDRKYLGGPVNLELPIDEVVKALLVSLDETTDIEVVNKASANLPVLSKFYSDKDASSGKKNPKRDQSYWDLIQSIISQAGLIAYIELDKLVISTPRVLYGTDKVKRFIYGKNVKNLSFKRKIGRRKNFNIIVRSMNLSTKEVIEAKIPAEATPEWSAATNIPNEEVKVPDSSASGKPEAAKELKAAPYMAFRITNVNSKDHLIEVGQNIYEELGRQQIEGDLSTADMVVPESRSDLTSGKETDKSEFDILKIRNGTPVSIWLDAPDMQNVMQFASKEARETYLKARGINSKAARYLSENIGKADASFYTRAVKFSLDNTQGFQCEIEFINFIQVTNPNVDTGA